MKWLRCSKSHEIACDDEMYVRVIKKMQLSAQADINSKRGGTRVEYFSVVKVLFVPPSYDCMAISIEGQEWRQQSDAERN
jgi:hypothetical protein